MVPAAIPPPTAVPMLASPEEIPAGAQAREAQRADRGDSPSRPGERAHYRAGAAGGPGGALSAREVVVWAKCPVHDADADQPRRGAEHDQARDGAAAEAR
jgi:hypothetical protein